MNHTRNRKLIKKRDAFIIGIILGAGIISLALFKAYSGRGNFALIFVDGKEVKKIELERDSFETFELNEAKGAVIEVSDGTICVKSSDCPDKICVNTGSISKKGERIVCLPKKLIIEIE